MTDEEFAARMAQFQTNPDLRTETEIYLLAQLEKARGSERTIWQALEIRLRAAVKDFPTEFPGTWGSMLNAVHLVAGSYRENPFTVRARAIAHAKEECAKVVEDRINRCPCGHAPCEHDDLRKFVADAVRAADIQ